MPCESTKKRIKTNTYFSSSSIPAKVKHIGAIRKERTTTQTRVTKIALPPQQGQFRGHIVGQIVIVFFNFFFSLLFLSVPSCECQRIKCGKVSSTK